MFKGNRIENSSQVPGQDKVNSIKLELAELGEIKSQYEKDISNGEKMASHYKDLDDKVLAKESELREINEKIGDSNKSLSIYLDLIKKIDESQEIQKRVKDRIIELEESKEKLQTEIDSLINKKNTEESNLNFSIQGLTNKLVLEKEEYDKFRNNADKWIEKYNEELLSLESNIKNLKSNISSLNSEISLLSSEKSKFISENEVMENQLRLAKENIDKIVSNAEMKSNKIIEEAICYKELIEKELVNREGSVSERESWLSEKEQTLKDTKLELEKFYNRKINNVII